MEIFRRPLNVPTNEIVREIDILWGEIRVSRGRNDGGVNDEWTGMWSKSARKRRVLVIFGVATPNNISTFSFI